MEANKEQGKVLPAKRIIVPSTESKEAPRRQDEEIEERDSTCYVSSLAASPPFAVESNQVVEMVASADSSNSICLFSRQNLEFIGKIPAHEDTITQISFDRTNASLLWSSSTDGSLKCWDLRSQKLACALRGDLTILSLNRISTISAPLAPGQIFTFNIGGEMMLVAGVKEKIMFWDMRRVETVTTPLVTFTESHTEDVTKVKSRFVFSSGLIKSA